MKRFKQLDFTKEIKESELRSFLMPLFFAAGFQNIYAIVNTAVVSRALSHSAAAVINACSGCVFIVNGTFSAFISGFGVRLARCIGSRDPEQIRNGFWSTVYLTAGMGILCLAFVPFSESILRMANIPSSLMPDSTVYFKFILFGALALYLKLILISALQAMGNSTVPAVLSMAGVVTQTVLTVVMINGLHGGIAASSLAMMLNNLCQITILIYFLQKFSNGRFRIVSPFRIQGSHYLDTLANGCSKGVMFLFMSVGSFFKQRMENTLPVSLLSGDAYCDQFTNLFTELLSIYGTAAVVIIGQNVACGNYDAIRDYVRRLYRNSIPLCIVIVILSLVSAPVLIGTLAGGGVSREVVRAGILQMRVISVSYPFLTALVLLRYTMQSMGDYRAMPLFGMIETLVVISVAGLIPRLGYTAVCLGPALSRITAGTAAIFYYLRFMRIRHP